MWKRKSKRKGGAMPRIAIRHVLVMAILARSKLAGGWLGGIGSAVTDVQVAPR